MANEKERELEEWAIIVRVPKDAVGLVIAAKILEGDNVIDCHKTLTAHELFKARNDFMDWVGDDDYDATYMLTEEGKRWAEELRKSNVGDTPPWGGDVTA